MPSRSAGSRSHCSTCTRSKKPTLGDSLASALVIVFATAPTSCSRAQPFDAKTQTHALVEAYDQSHADDVERMLAKSFQRVEQGRFHDAPHVLAELRAGEPNRVVRRWSEEHVTSSENVVTFVGAAKEDFGKRSFDFWNTLVWAREGDAWKLALWQVERIPTAREEWNETYRLELGFNRKPNQLLVDATKDVPPGAALDIAMGQGRNALYLAEHGWKVTGVDISDEGIRIARKTADERKLSLDTIEADTATWDFGREKWDLVTLIYAGADPRDIERIRTALRPGGMVVVEVFHADGTAGTRSGGFATGELAKLFAGYRIVRDDVVDDISDWGGADERKLVRFVATKPR